jgi:hypothetical protein
MTALGQGGSLSRFHLAIIAGLTTAIAAHAGQITLGGANGLTAAYINAPNTVTGQNTTGCAGGVGNCVAGSGTSSWGERNYDASLFENGSISQTSTNGNNIGTQIITNSTTSYNPGVNSWTDSAQNVTFNLINDGSSASSGNELANNIWASSTGANQNALTIPVGVFGVDESFLLLNDYYGYAGANPVITFNFSTTGSTGTINAADSITLVDTAGGAGAIRSAVQCLSTSGTSITCPATTNGSGSGSGHTVSAGAPITGTQSFTSGDASITTSTLWTGTYSGTVTSTPYGNSNGSSSGNVMLDDIGFNFGTKYNSDWLVSITITPSAANEANASRLALSAITVETATPEPSTLALCFVVMLVVGTTVVRRRQHS